MSEIPYQRPTESAPGGERLPKSVRDKVDPQHRLPEVELRVTWPQEFEHFSREQMAIEHNGTQVGVCDLIVQHGLKVHFDGIELAPAERGRGYGLATYVKAIERAQELGLPFETQEITQTKDAKKIWETLVRAGVAQEIEPFCESRSVDGEPRYEGRYVVPAPEVAL